MNPEKIEFLEKEITDISSHADKTPRRGSWRIAKDFPTSFYYAFQGLSYAFLSQRNFRIQVFLGLFAFSFGIGLGLNSTKIAIIIFSISIVLILELINTAIEVTVDLAIGRRFHPLARIAKDCAAGAVLIASASAFLLALFILLPPFLVLLGF